MKQEKKRDRHVLNMGSVVDMAIYRTVQISFWSDTKVEEDFTPEDKYFYLYLFTNPHTNLSGCFKLGLKQAANQLGYNKDTVERLIERFSTVHNVIKYSAETNEIFIKNWSKYNWTKSSKFLSPLRNEIMEIKNDDFRNELSFMFDKTLTEAVQKASDKEKERLENIPYIYGMDTTVTVTVNNNVSNNSLSNTYLDIYKDIIDYFNEKTGKRYSYKTKSTQSMIKARLNDGYEVDDFKTVIDNKVNDWLGNDDFEKYLRPETIFCTKHFEGYLNQPSKKKEIIPVQNIGTKPTRKREKVR